MRVLWFPGKHNSPDHTEAVVRYRPARPIRKCLSATWVHSQREREYVALGKCKLVGLRVNVGLSHVAHADIHMAEVQVPETACIVGT